jgi:energy-coupling factor transporter ATP-binding protein EcfA2
VSGNLEYRTVSFGYPDGPAALTDVDLTVTPGDVLLVVGASGSGKSTLLRAANGLVPHSTGGRFGGEVIVAGRSTRDHPPRLLADVVGFVHQDPEAQFVVDRVESDVAFGLENLGVDPTTMRRRVEEVLDALGVAHLRDRNPAELSGGERQRCAIAGALVTATQVLVLDEPTSQLDPQGAEDVLAAVARLNADLGTTVLLAEHRLERAAPIADGAIRIDAGRIVHPPAPPATVLADYPGAPPVTRLGHHLGWDPVPLTVRDARRHARATTFPPPPAVNVPARGPELLRATGVDVVIGRSTILHRVDLDLCAGDVVALLGRNGSGKTSLLRALAGLIPVERGTVTGTVTRAYVPQDPSSLLFRPTVRAEIAETLRLLGRTDPAAVEFWIDALGLEHVAERHPRSLSGGERQRVAIAAVAVGGASILLLDEPTRGMDAQSRAALERTVATHRETGGVVVLATHDVELAARCATRAVVLGDGEVVAAGPAREVLAGSRFAPQIARVVPGYLTVEDVEAAWERT